MLRYDIRNSHHWDSLTIIKKCRSITLDESVISPYIEDIKSLLGRFRQIWFHRERRSMNKLVDSIATESLRSVKESYLFSIVLRCVVEILEDKYIHEPN